MLFFIFQFLSLQIICPFPWLMLPIICDLLMSFTEKFIIFILLLTMSTMILSVLCLSMSLIGTLWKRSDVLLPYCSSSSICSLRCITSLRKFALSCLSVVLSCCRHVIVSPCLCIMSINGFTAFVTASATADVMIFFRCASAFVITFSYILGTIDSRTGSFRSVDLVKSFIL
jgi:hypothetical protein